MGFFNRSFNGITDDTAKKIQLDAGAFFKNFVVGTDTYATAKAAGKILSATQGGGEISLKPTFRQISVDGAKGRVKGLADIESWECYIKATMVETDVDKLSAALACADVDSAAGVTGYTKIVGRNAVDDTDYIDNITWVGRQSGSQTPIIFQIFNALNEDGMTMTVADKAEGKLPVTFYGYNSIDEVISDTVAPPFALWLPTEESEGGGE